MTDNQVLPSLHELLDGAVAYRVALTHKFRGLETREGLLLKGPSGWGEFAPFHDYRPAQRVRWLEAAIEAGWGQWPAPIRDAIAVNAIVPAVGPTEAGRIVRESGCSTVKIKVGERGQTIDDDIERVTAVREALGVLGRIRIDANGAWALDDAERNLALLSTANLEYVEQPCSSMTDMASLRRRVDMPLAIDEGIRTSDDPQHVAGVRDAADVLILKVAPLGGVAKSMSIAANYGLPVVVSSALETGIGLSAGVALAAALPRLSYACGLGTASLLRHDVALNSPITPRSGVMGVARVDVESSALFLISAPSERLTYWRACLADTYAELGQLRAPGTSAAAVSPGVRAKA